MGLEIERAGKTLRAALRPVASPLLRPFKTSINNGLRFSREKTASYRMFPQFIIIGGQRCGTTSLYRYLTAHPSVGAASRKEIGFFDYRFKQGMKWYQSHFPLGLRKRGAGKGNARQMITGEATPDYMIHPYAPENIRRELPQVKIIMLLRNPVDRAYSHYLHHHIRYNVESLPFEQALKNEPIRLDGEIEKIHNDRNYYSYNLRMYSYLNRGRYVDHLKRWRQFFSKERILIIRSEDLYSEPDVIYKQALDFLNLPSIELHEYKKHNGNEASRMSSAVRDYLYDYFAPYNCQLYDYLGRDFGWER